MFEEKKNLDGNYICYLCTGTFVKPDEIDAVRCKYTGEVITNQYASRKYWLNPIEYFYSKIEDIKEVLEFSKLIARSNQKISELLIPMLYSQLVTAIEVFLNEKFKQGLQSEEIFDNFVVNYKWNQKYTPNQLHKNIHQIVKDEIERFNFQNFYECGYLYKIAFNIDVFSFPKDLKRNINRILRYRHGLVHQDEIWEKNRFVRIDYQILKSDIEHASNFVKLLIEQFESTIGIAPEMKFFKVKTENLDEGQINSCEECPLGERIEENLISCYEGAYDGIGFSIKKEDWKSHPYCEEMTFKEAMRQRKLLGEKGIFGRIALVHKEDANGKNNNN